MELLLVPSEEPSGSGTQKLICSGWGFNPKIKWLSGSEQRSAADNEIRMGEDGHVALTSHITVTQQEWNEGKDFICEVDDKDLQKTVRKSTSLCTGTFPSSTPSIHLETPRFRTVMTQTEVTATCVVHSAYDAKVSWLLDGKHPTSRTPVNQASRTTQSISSNLTLPSSQWKTLNTITCRAEHRCFNSTEKTSNVKGPAVSSTTTVLIRRSLPELLKGDSAVLECAITQLSSSDLYVTFQSNGVDFPEKQYVDLPASNGPHSLTRRFSIPKSHWNTDNTFTCKVNQGFSNSLVSSSKVKLFSELSMELLLVPSEEPSGSGTQKLICSGWGFNPKIKWLSGSEQRSAADNEIRMGEDGHVALTSHITVTQQEWNEGKDFICEVDDKDLQKTVRKSTSLCTGTFPSSTPSLHLETPRFRTVMTQTEVTATCVVHSAYDAKVSWLLDGKHPTSRTPVNQASRTTQSISSNLTLPSSQWKTLNTITCRAEHRCFNSTEKTSNVKGPAVSSTTTVLIRRSLPELLKGDSAVLECAITQLSSSDLYVTFQSNGVDFPEKQYVDLPASNGPHSLTRRFSIPKSHWNTDNTFTCKVNQGFSNSLVSSSKVKLFSELSMELLLVPSEEPSGSGTQKLICSGWGFNPKIKWLSGSEQRSAADNEIRMGEDGHVALTSHITVTQQEWNEGKDFICEVDDKDLQKTVRKSTSLCTGTFPSSTPSIHLETPRFRTVMTQTEVTATCVVHSAYDAKVSWLLDGKHPTSRTPVNQASRTTQSISSNLTLPSSQWKTLNTITCRAEHRCFNSTEKTSNVKGSVTPSAPTATLLQDPSELVCLVLGFSPSDINITWLLDNVTELWNNNTSTPYRAPGGKFGIRSHLSLAHQDLTPGAVYTCRVTHTTQTLALNISKPEILEVEGVFFDENRSDPILADTAEENWNMACSFLVLFLISLLYSFIVTLVKTK
ncbi:uncharacterized protein LOC135554519 isoform X1 [Oncorhynchus masou masou]|uniref:uncharacterized protein LOC135554519 isoform X1 n=1 Tax=Oncorhynchus masou masou TaxID=90313 RepID=UPI0031843CC4